MYSNQSGAGGGLVRCQSYHDGGGLDPMRLKRARSLTESALLDSSEKRNSFYFGGCISMFR